MFDRYKLTIRPEITSAAAVFPYDSKLAKNFWYRGKFSDEQLPLYLKVKINGEGDKLFLPRALAPLGELDRRSRGDTIVFHSNFQPRNDEQVRIIERSWELLSKDESFILEAPTGIGKTWMAMELIARVAKRTLVIVTKEDIKEQWRVAAKSILGLSDRHIGIVQGDKCETDRLLVIAMIQSVCKLGRYRKEAFDDFGFLIVDEVHRMGADKFSQAMWAQPAKLRLGLSATPYRADGKDLVFQAHIGPVKVKSDDLPLTPTVYVLRSNWKLPWVTWGGVYQPYPHEAGKLGKVNTFLSQDPERNARIVSWVKAYWKKDRKIIVFSALRKHLSDLKEILAGAGIPKSHMGFYVGGLSEKQLRENGRKPIVLATYAFASEATDLPWLDVAVLATPRSEVKQIVGRILRAYPGKTNPIVLDILDSDSPILANYGRKRKKWYVSVDARIKSGTLRQRWMDKTHLEKV